MSHLFTRVRESRPIQGLAKAASWTGRGVLSYIKRLRPGERVDDALDGLTNDKKSIATKNYSEAEQIKKTLPSTIRKGNAEADKAEAETRILDLQETKLEIEVYVEAKSAGLTVARDHKGRLVVSELVAVPQLKTMQLEKAIQPLQIEAPKPPDEPPMPNA